MIGFGSSVIGMGIAIKLHDMFSSTARNVVNSMKQIDDQGRALARVGGMEVVGGALVNYGKKVNTFFKEGIMLAADYEKSFAKVGVELDNFTQKDRTLLDNTIDRLSRTYGLSKNLLGLATVDIARQGVDKADWISNLLDASSMLSRATDLPVQTVADSLGDMMMMFNKTPESALDFADKIAYAANKSNVEVRDIFKSVSYLGPSFRNVGATAEEALAIVGALANAGIKGSRAGTAINQWIIQLSTAMGKFRTEKQASVLQKWGLSVEDVTDPVTGQVRNLVEVIQLLGSRAMDGTLNAASEVAAVFNTRGGRALAAAFANPVGKDIGELFQGITQDAGGFASKIAGAVAGSYGGEIDRMTESYTNFKLEIGQTFKELVIAVAPAITKVMQLAKALVSTPFGKALVYIAAIASALAVVLGTILIIGGAVAAWKLIFGGIGVSIFGTVTLFSRWLNILSKVAPYLTLMRVTSGINPATGWAWFREGGKFTSWKSIFTGGWIARGLSSVGSLLTSLGRVLGILPKISVAATATGTAMGSAAWASLGPWGLVAGAIYLIGEALDTSGIFTWRDTLISCVEAIIAPFVLLYSVVKMASDAMSFNFHGPLDDLNRIMGDVHNSMGKYSWERKADEEKAKLGYTSREKNKMMQTLREAFPQESDEKLQLAMAAMFPGQKQMTAENEAAGGYYEDGQWIPSSRAARVASGQATTNLNIWIDGQRKITKEVSKTMDEHLKADE